MTRKKKKREKKDSQTIFHEAIAHRPYALNPSTMSKCIEPSDNTKQHDHELLLWMEFDTIEMHLKIDKICVQSGIKT